MTIEQTVEIPVSRRLTIEVPRDIPAGRAILAFTPAPDPNHKPISRHFGRLKNSKAFAGDPMEIQRQMRAEWDD
ncbi:hypothetical protein FACS1894172_21150 [Spirochaetia bacterium]|nr:hypothetical protein FACS1894172_21150 [Spirochaetia bacterium]